MKPENEKHEDWLDWFTHSDTEENTSLTFPLPDGRRCATDGRFAVMIGDSGPVGPPLEDSGRRKRRDIPKQLCDMTVATPFKTAPPLSLADLKAKLPAFVGVTEIKCVECYGSKKVPHTCGCELCDVVEEPCGTCDATGSVFDSPDNSYCTIMGVPFDAQRVGYVLAHCPEQPSYMLSVIADKNDMLVIKTAAWTALLVALVESVKHEHDCPEVFTDA